MLTRIALVVLLLGAGIVPASARVFHVHHRHFHHVVHHRYVPHALMRAHLPAS